MPPTIVRRMACAHVLMSDGWVRVGASTRGRRSLQNNELDNAAKEQLRSAAGERVELIF